MNTSTPTTLVDWCAYAALPAPQWAPSAGAPAWVGEHCFADSQDFVDAPLEELVSRWLRGDIAAARVYARTGHGIASTWLRYVVATPQLGLFLHRHWTHETHERVVAAVQLASRVVRDFDAVQAAGGAGASQRLVIVDDDLDGGQRWAWVGRASQDAFALRADPAMYLSVLANLDARQRKAA